MTMIKLDYLRERAAAYLRDAETTDNPHAAARLRMLAALCRELIRDLEKSAVKDTEGNS